VTTAAANGGPLTQKLLSRRETARLLNISEKALDRLIAGDDGPPTVRVGDRVLVVAGELDAWIRQRLARPGKGGSL
jgi:predicted DNA-binding transcriptional regulator AlpA